MEKMSVVEYDTKLFQNSIRYLHNVITLPETNVPVLRSFLCLKRKLMELRKNIFLPANATKPNMHCQRCFLNLFDGPATYKIKSKPTKYTFADKILSKQRSGLPLTKYQQKYLKKMKKFSGNQLVTTCKFCKLETYTKLEKPRLKFKVKNTAQHEYVIKKRKKSKKDKYCGLNQNIVSSLPTNKRKNKDRERNIKTPNTSNDITRTPLSRSNFQKSNNSILKTNHANSQTPISNNESRNKKNYKFIPLNSNTPIFNKSKNKNETQVIYIDSDESVQEVHAKRKMKKKKPIPIQTSTPLQTPITKKKNKNNKLCELLKNSGKKNKSSSLMNFLQDL